MNRVYLGVQPGKNMIQSDIAKMRKESDKYIQDLVAWTNEEIELLSFNKEKTVKRKGFGKSEQGFFKSIYQEKMFFYGFKEYVATSKRLIFYARTKNNEIIYQIKKGGTQVYVDAQFLGEITASGDFYNEKSRRFFGSLKRPSKTLTKVYNEQDKLLGSIVLPDDWENTINPRATDMESKLDEKDLLLFKILSIYEILLIHIEKDKQ